VKTEPPCILAVNAGSSSIRFAIYEATDALPAIDRLPQTGSQGTYLRQQLNDKLVEHTQSIEKYGEDMPEIRQWKWVMTPASA
jgi:phosphoketolase